MTDQKIVKLTDYQHARHRVGMYLGSKDPHTQALIGYTDDGKPIMVDRTWVPAVFTSFREILDNAIDETITHGHGDRIDVKYDELTGIISVQDNGRGIPIGFDEKHQQYTATMALSETKAGRNFGDRGSSRGMNGLGASVVNFCSEWFDLEINRDRQTFTQRFHEGDGKQANLIIDDPLVFPVKKQTQTGTRVEFKLSKHVFKDTRLPLDFVRSRMYEVCLCYPKLKVFFNGEQIKLNKTVEKSLFPDHKPIQFEVNREGFKSHFWLVPEFFADGSEYSHSLVNAIPVFNGGTHIETFKRSFFAGLLTALERESRKRKLVPNKSDVGDGMLVYNITEMDGPEFDSQSKTRLTNENVAKYIKADIDDPDFFKKIVRQYPDWINAIYERCAERTQKKDADELKKLNKASKRTKVDKLLDATGSDRSKCILFLAEGDSAISGLTSSRTAAIHGGLPLRGKVLNVNGEKLKTIVENFALKQIMDSVGLFPGQKAERNKLRYGKIFITCDADEDGKNITALLVNFFYTLWPELFQDENNPFVHVFDTPLIIINKGKQRKYWYSDNANQFDPEDYRGWSVTRAKGLAQLVKEDWNHVLANPKVVPMIDDGELKETLDMIFSGTRADDRKTWLQI